MGFIPDLGVSKKETSNGASKSSAKADTGESNEREKKASAKQKQSKKKIVSYNLEVDLIDRVKDIANEKDMYYSSLVSLALKRWVMENS